MPKPKKIKAKKKPSKVKNKSHKKYLLRLYVVGQTPNCREAYNNLKNVCDELIPNGYTIEIVDLLKLPQLARSEQIVAIPTVIKKLPKPVRRIIGNLSNKEKVLVGLGFSPKKLMSKLLLNNIASKIK